MKSRVSDTPGASRAQPSASVRSSTNSNGSGSNARIPNSASAAVASSSPASTNIGLEHSRPIPGSG